MYELYTWSTPNGRKVSIMLEELGLEYTVHPINILKEEQFAPEFLKISPNNKIPAIVDTENGQTLMESGAILLYLANKHDSFLPEDEAEKWKTIEWLMWQMGGLGPMLGQAHHFVHFNPEKSDYAKQRYSREAARLYSVLDKQLSDKKYLTGDTYTIADIATWPWISRFEWQGVNFKDYPNVLRWYKDIAARPAVQKGFVIPNPADIVVPD
ncbi:MAG: glutathione S-transferase [Gammaproteobacteria bacterium]|nr:glutathione S-transferase [Gammaproteobacteria bacterium]